jgi:murein DD-endopeptidase MepM/ murein hydrolase activator NlpD
MTPTPQPTRTPQPTPTARPTRTPAPPPTPFAARAFNASEYRLPWGCGLAFPVIQGAQGEYGSQTGPPPGREPSHRGLFAWDIAMPDGHPVLAARAGTVSEVRDDLRATGPNLPGNYVLVRHDDGTVAGYYHLQPAGAKVRAGQRVERGQHLAGAGQTGDAYGVHLHFEVTDPRLPPLGPARGTQPVAFGDIPTDNGALRAGLLYTSGNAGPNAPPCAARPYPALQLLFGTDYDQSRGQPTTPGQVFSARTPVIYASVRGLYAPAGATIAYHWYHGAYEVWSCTVRTERLWWEAWSQCAWRPGHPWDPGDYQVEIHIDNDVAAAAAFRIVPG